jgi:RNA polymerase sigma-70 factor (ECF subfamily)
MAMIPAGETDEALVSRARRGDEAAFARLVERHAPALRARIKRQLPAALRRKVSESDVMQVAYLAAHQRLADFEARGEGSFRNWIHQIADFKVQEVLRRYLGTAKRAAHREVSKAYRPQSRDLVDHDAASPSQHAIAGELEAAVREALTTLPDHYRLILHLVQDEGLTLQEAGERMDRSAGAAEKLYGRAIYQLTRAVFGERTT